MEPNFLRQILGQTARLTSTGWFVTAVIGLALAITGLLLSAGRLEAQYPRVVGSLSCQTDITSAETNNTVELTAVLRDDLGRPITGEPIYFIIANQPGDTAAVNPPERVADLRGAASTDLFMGQTEGEVVVRATNQTVECAVTVFVSGQQQQQVGGQQSTSPPVVVQPPPVVQTTNVPTTGPTGGEARPKLISDIGGIFDVSTDPAVVAANGLLALLFMILVLLATTIFNETIKENAGAIEGVMAKVSAPVAGIVNMNVWHTDPSGLVRWLRPLGIMSLTAVVYSLLEPGFGLNETSLVVVLGLIIGLGIVTTVYEASQVFIAERLYNLSGGVRLFPIALVFAALSVAASKLLHLHPGVIYGFVAAAALTTSESAGRRPGGQILFGPMVALLLVSIGAWALIEPARSLSEGSESWLAAVPETAAAIVFVGGLQGLLFVLVPLTFTDGHKVWTWNPILWMVLALVTGFTAFHLLINREHPLDSVLVEEVAQIPLIVCVSLVVISSVTWLAFRIWRGGEE
jgi:hypothetical protein